MSIQGKFPGKLRVVIVGRHRTVKQHSVAHQLMIRGAIIQRHVNTETDILVALSNTQGADAARAIEMRNIGHPIVFPREVDLNAMLDDPVGFFDSLPLAIRSRRLAVADAPAGPMLVTSNSEPQSECADLQLRLFPSVPRRQTLFLMNL